MSPLEDTIVALRPIPPKQPFGLPDSYRPLSPSKPIGSAEGFAQVDPFTGQPLVGAAMVTNQVVNFGWEYVWHCHILSHEEDDMMRPMSMYVASGLPAAPVLGVAATPAGLQLRWTDATPADAPSTVGDLTNEVGFRIERKTAGSAAFAPLGEALANTTSYVDPAGAVGDVYRVSAYNAAGEGTSNEVTATGTVVVPATGVTLGASVASPSFYGTPVVFTAQGQGSTDPYEYRFWLSTNAGASYSLVRGWSAASAWTLPGTAAVGTYRVLVEVRTSVGPSAEASAYVNHAVRIAPATGVTLSADRPSPVAAGTAVKFTASGQGASGYDYQFWVDDGTGSRIVQDYGGGSVWVLPGTTPIGQYLVRVYVRTSTFVAKDASAALTYVVRVPPATGVKLAAALPSPQVFGTPVVFTATGQGSSGYQYQFWVDAGLGATMVQDYSVASTWTMPGTTPVGQYRVTAYVRTSPVVGRDASSAVTYSIRLAPATGVALTASLRSPQPFGTTVLFTAAGQGSSGYQYQFWFDDGATTSMVQDYGVGSTWTLPNTTPVGSYRVLVYVRTSALVARDASGSLAYAIRIPPATGVTLTVDKSSPQPQGTAVQFTASGLGSYGYDYQYWVDAGTGPQMVQDYGGGAVYTLPDTTAVGTYLVYVYVRTSPLVLRDVSGARTYSIVAPLAAVP